MKHRLAVAAAVLIASGCAQTSITNAWKAPDDPGPAFRRIMVVGVTSRADVRRTFEDGFVAELKAKGVDAVPSYASEPQLGPESKEKLKAAAKATGADGVLVTRLVRRETHVDVMPGTPPPLPMRRGLSGYYPYAWGGYYDSPTVVQTEVVTAEVNVFRTATEKLAWAGTSETFGPGDIAGSTREFAKAVITALSKARLI